MSMFCYQCQETAKGTGCTISGVCGKTEKVANMQDLLVYVIKGISIYSTKARELGIENDNVNKFIVDGLFMTITNANFDHEETIIERSIAGKPHAGKVLLAIQAHSDDIPLFAGGTVAKLMDEGYKGYLLRTSDDKSGDYEGNRVDNEKIAKFFGMEKAYDFLYPHHQMDAIQIQDLKARLIFLFRLLKVDTVICWDPWEHYEENPDHVATAHAVEAARWMAGMGTDYPEQLDAGITPHAPSEMYYFSRNPQRANRIVDITNYIDKKVESNMINVTKGPAGRGKGKALKSELAKEGKKLAILGDDDNLADFNYIKHFVFDIDARRLNFSNISNRELGEQYGLGWAERFHYVSGDSPNKLEQYIKNNAISS